MSKRISTFVNLLVLLSIVLPWGTIKPTAVLAAQNVTNTGMYRAVVSLPNEKSQAKLAVPGVRILTQGTDWAQVLVTADQLERLARLGFQPRNTDELGALVEADAKTRAWLAEGLRLDLEQAQSYWAQAEQAGGGLEIEQAASVEATTALEGLHDILAGFTPEQVNATSTLTSLDDDADGLTNTEETWWCTDPLNPNSDGDAHGYGDGQEVIALLDFTLSRSVRWGYGPPFGPPNAWPDWNGGDGNPNTPACNDGDWDTIPDYAEAYYVGTKVPAESSDNDKFDDGQELFGITYCPGAPTNCGYGNYPRIEYWNYIKESMPSWVRSPGDNPFVASFPVPEVSVDPLTWHVERVTTITTAQGEMVQNEHTYQTSVTEGQSSSIADTVTWNEWEEVSKSIETPINLQAESLKSPQSLKKKLIGTGLMVLGGGVIAGAAALGVGVCTTGIACPVGAVIGAVGGAFGSEIIGSGWETFWSPDEAQNQEQVNKYEITNINNVSSSASANASINLSQNFDFQGMVSSLDGIQYAMNQQSELLARGLYDISYAISQPRFTETRTNGKSWGGAQTTTHEVYEEHTVTQGEAFTTGQNWSTAWAVDSSHAADLTFTYKIENNGTDYTRELEGLIFNVYLGEDPNPIISYPAWQQFPNGIISNLFPGDVVNQASNPIALTLEQMRRIDLGEKLTVTVEDFNYGADELFYQDAVNGGVTIYIEDGVEDGDELVDQYVIPTWGTESVQDVLTRYFPHEVDQDGNLNSLWTPEFDGINPPTWNEHYLSNIAWWNIYFTQTGVGDQSLDQLPAEAGSALLFRFNRDSDFDGYPDRVELQYSTDKDDPASHPQPEVLAGYTVSRSGNNVTVLLKMANTGTFDAYGIDAVMYAPDSTTTITNNTIGGNGRVRPNSQMVVGSQVKPPDVTNWDNSTADPYSTGYFSGAADEVITFTVNTPGTVGSGTTKLNWSSNVGGSGTLNVGGGYHAPLPLAVQHGVEIGFDTGTIQAGDSFTVQALTPRDTFQYTINSEPYVEPVIVVSYSDPQGSRKFVTPVQLASPSEDLTTHSGEMLPNVRLEINTRGPVDPVGVNTTDFIINSPDAATIANGHLYLNFVSNGQLMAELSYTLDVESGPTVYGVDWSTSLFSQSYDPNADNILVAFWTDSQDNIIDSAARPFPSFADDPRPGSMMRAGDELWDFGTAQQGTLMQRTMYLGSTGYQDLLTYLETSPSITVDGPLSAPIAPGDVAEYTLTINTQYLAVGAFSEAIEVSTSDPADPTRTIAVQGNVTAMPDDAPGGAIIRPLDWTLNVTGTHNQGEWVEYTHALGPAPQSLHPVKVYSQDYATLWGVGKYSTDFGLGTSSSDMFGDGSDGSLTLSSNTTFNPVDSSCSGTSGTTTLYATNSSFAPGQKILIHQTQGTNAGVWEIQQILSYSGGIITTSTALLNNYYSSGSDKAQVLVLREYSDLLINSGVTWSVKPWNGTVGGILAFMANGNVTINGTIRAQGSSGGSGTNDNSYGGIGGGFRGGNNSTDGSSAGRGESYAGSWPNESRLANFSGGGGADGWNYPGGGGGNGTSGGNGWPNDGGSGYGIGGNKSQPEDFTRFFFGGGGGGGRYNDAGGGGSGGGLIFLIAQNLNTVNGYLNASGGNGGGSIVHPDKRSAGGAGAGGSIFLKFGTAQLGSSKVTANRGGVSGATEGQGGDGRIRLEYCQLPSGTTSPAATTEQLYCYIAEQMEQTPYDQGRLNLSEATPPDRTYQIQYGRRYVFSGAGLQTFSIRIPKKIYADASLDALVSNTGVTSGPLNLKIDVGNNGTWDWTHNATTSFPATFDDITGIVGALNNYMVSQSTVPWDAEIDVPFKVEIDRQADVILTDLVLSQQYNQPAGAEQISSVNTTANLPLDWTVNVTGVHNKGEWVNFTHTMGRDPVSLHPAKVFSQDYATQWGVGKYSTDFGSNIDSYDMFGDGRDGPLTISANTTNNPIDSTCSGTSGAYTLSATNVNFAPGQLILIHQTQGTNAGIWMINKIVGYSSGVITLTQPLNATFGTGAQVLVVKQYTNVTINTGVTWAAKAWNGTTGGILTFRANGAVTIAGTISTNGNGFRGGSVPYSLPDNKRGTAGEGTAGPQIPESGNPNGNGGGGGDWDYDTVAVSAGGSNGTAAANGSPSTPNNRTGGYGGTIVGSLDLSHACFGGGGASGANSEDHGIDNWHGGAGGNGGGVIFINASTLNITGYVSSNGNNGDAQYPNNMSANGGGGGGAGGSILLKGRIVNLGANNTTATGGSGGAGDGGSGGLPGTNGGSGRIRVEYCDSYSGNTNPVAITQQLTCQIVEQIETVPYDQGRLNLPENVTDSKVYKIQYGRRFVFGGLGNQSSYLRVNRELVGSASMDVLVSNTGVASGLLTLSLDIGNDGVNDWTHNATTSFPATLPATGLQTAFNTYLLSRNDIPWGDPIDMPVKVTIDRKADVMLTNLALTPSGAKTRFLRLDARSYDEVKFSLKFLNPGISSGPLSFTVDIGADGSTDWSYSGTPGYPAVIWSPDLDAAFNSYLTGRTGEVDVPLRIVPSPYLDTYMEDSTAKPTGAVNLSITPTDIVFSDSPMETDPVTVTATLHNLGARESGPLAAAFYATAQGFGEWYIGSDFVTDVPAGGTAQAQITWNTLGFTGDVPVRVEIDPFDRVVESDETDNSVSKNLTILTRPDLNIVEIVLSDPEPMEGEAITVTLNVSNSGQMVAAAQMVALYDGDPQAGGMLIGEQAVGVPPGSQIGVNFTWNTTVPGSHRLFAVVDRDGVVNEFDEGNNQSWRDVYIGFASPLLLDSGAAGEPVYSISSGYGFVDEGQPDATGTCGVGTSEANSYRRDPDGTVVYQFDHLLPGHYYHLDLTLYECDGAGRQESIFVDGNLLSGLVDLSDGQPHPISILLDPALYADHVIRIEINDPGIDGSVVSVVNLYDIDYRYADAGGSNDPQYTGQHGFGWLDGVVQTSWGTLPYQSVRNEQNDAELRYRFDQLNAVKQYRVNMTFFQGSGAARQQRVDVDGVSTGLTVNTGDYQVHTVSTIIPQSSYQTDGSVIVAIVRTNASTGAFVNEISLEELTQAAESAPGAYTKTAPSNAATGFPTNPTLSWGASGGVEHYEYCYDAANDSACGGTWANNGTTTSIGLSGLASGTTYYWQVRAVNANGTTYADNGTWWSFTTQANPVSAPSTLTAAAVSQTQINLSWQDNSSDETNFRIERSPDGSTGWTEIATATANSTTYNNTGLTAGTTYYYRVRAYRSSDTSYSSYSNTANATTFTTLVAPSTLTATAVSQTQINLSWQDNSSDETNFRIERSPDGSTGWTEIATATANSTTYNNTGLTAGTTYYYRVRAYRSSDTSYSSYSNTDDATTQPVTGCGVSWQTEVQVHDNTVVTDLVTIGQGANASDGLDSACGETLLPPKPPAGSFDSRLILPGGTQASKKDYRNDSQTDIQWRIEFQPGSGGYPFTFTWDPAALPVGSWILRDVFNSMIHVDMKAQNSYTLTNSDIDKLIIEYHQQVCSSVSVSTGWNMTSVPVQASDMKLSSLFPDVVAPAYYYTNAYQAVNAGDALATGEGYWMYFTAPHTYQICGAIVSTKDIAVTAGWNMIGPFDQASVVSTITSTPAGILVPPVYGYSTAYAEATSLQPGKGYWAYVSQSGTLHLGSGGLASQVGIPAWRTGLGVPQDFSIPIGIEFDGQKVEVTFGVMTGGTTGFDPGMDWLAPPPGPDGMLDAHWQADGVGYLREVRGYTPNPITYDLLFNPVMEGKVMTLKWDSQALAKLGEFRVLDRLTGKQVLDMRQVDQLEILPGSDWAEGVLIEVILDPPVYRLYLPFAKR